MTCDRCLHDRHHGPCLVVIDYTHRVVVEDGGMGVYTDATFCDCLSAAPVRRRPKI